MADAVYDIVARDQTKKGFTKAEKQARGFTGKINTAFSKIKIPALIAGGVALGGIAVLTSQLGGFLDKADMIDKAAKRTGLGALAIQRLNFAAEQFRGQLRGCRKGHYATDLFPR